MVFPIGDDNTGRATTPLVNYALIAANVLVFVLFQGLGSEQNRFTYAWATVPQEIVTGRDVVTPDRVVTVEPTNQRIHIPGLQPTPGSVYLTLLVSMFMHGGLMHLLGNMLFLWIFGDNIEDDLGHVRYLLFYAACAALAALAHAWAMPESTSPLIGASGAVSGVVAAYVLLHPNVKLWVLILFRVPVKLKAMWAIGAWIV